MKSELQEVMGMLRKLQGSIDFGNAPADEIELDKLQNSAYSFILLYK